MLARLRAYFNRPVLFKWVLAAYIGLLLGFSYTLHVGREADRNLSHESLERATQLCQVVQSVHNNAKLRVRSDRDEVENSRRIYRLSRKDSPVRPVLRERIKTAQGRVRVGEKGVQATALPPICKLYLKEK